MKTIEINERTYEVVEVDATKGELTCEQCAFANRSCCVNGNIYRCTTLDHDLAEGHYVIFKEIVQ